MLSDKCLTPLKDFCKSLGLSITESSESLVKEEVKDTHLEVKKSHDLVQQISVEIVAEPYIEDAHGQWYSKETVQKGFESAVRAVEEGRLNMNLFHEIDDTSKDNIELLKQYIVPFDCEVNGQKVVEGSWIAEVKWHNKELWKMRTELNEKGELEIAGLSLRGWGTVYKEESEEE